MKICKGILKFWHIVKVMPVERFENVTGMSLLIAEIFIYPIGLLRVPFTAGVFLLCSARFACAGFLGIECAYSLSSFIVMKKMRFDGK